MSNVTAPAAPSLLTWRASRRDSSTLYADAPGSGQFAIILMDDGPCELRFGAQHIGFYRDLETAQAIAERRAQAMVGSSRSTVHDT